MGRGESPFPFEDPNHTSSTRNTQQRLSCSSSRDTSGRNTFSRPLRITITTKMAEPPSAKKPRVDTADAAADATLDTYQAATAANVDPDTIIDTTTVSDPRRLELMRVPGYPPIQPGQLFYERQCFDEYYKLLVGLLEKGTSCVTLTGSAESGLTTFYAYFVERYTKTHADACVLAIASSRLGIVDVAVFEGEADPRNSYDEHDLEKFIRNAAARAKTEKKPLLQVWNGPLAERQSCCQTVVITSPNTDWFRYMDRFGPTYYMPLWTREELHEAARVLGLPVDEATIDERFRVFGGTPCRCLHKDPAVVERAVDFIDNAIARNNSLSDLIQLLVGTEISTHRMSLVYYEPSSDGVDGPRVPRLASPYVEEKLAARLLTFNSSERRKIRAWLPSVRWAVGLLNRFIEGNTQDEEDHGDDRTSSDGGYWRKDRKRSRPGDKV